jgi:hypothetical protein
MKIPSSKTRVKVIGYGVDGCDTGDTGYIDGYVEVNGTLYALFINEDSGVIYWASIDMLLAIDM